MNCDACGKLSDNIKKYGSYDVGFVSLCPTCYKAIVNLDKLYQEFKQKEIENEISRTRS